MGWGTQKLKGFMRMWGSIAQRLACLLPDSAALGSTPSIPKKNFRGKNVDDAEVNQRRWLKESPQ